MPASEIFVGGAISAKPNVVVRYRGTGARKPILLLAHIDVVEARREAIRGSRSPVIRPWQFLHRYGARPIF